MSLNSVDLTGWLALLEEEREPVFVSAWMSCVTARLTQLKEAVLVLGPMNAGPFVPVAFWPHQTPCSASLGVLCEQGLDLRRVIQRQEQGHSFLILPVLKGKDVLGVVGLTFVGQIPAQAREWVQWGIGWLLARPQHGGMASQAALTERMLLVMDVLLAAMSQDSLLTSAQAATTAAAHQLGCDRVSLGLGSGQQIRLIALSHSAEFSRRLDLVQALEACMHEAADQGSVIRFQKQTDQAALAHDDMQIKRSHEALLRHHGNELVLTVPFWIDEDRYGALLFEWANMGVSDELLSVAEGLTPVLGRALLDKQQANLSLMCKAWQSVRHPLKRWLGDSRVGLKLTIIVIVVGLLVMAVTPATFKVSASASLEGSVRRVVAAPFDGFVASAFYRAGQAVQQGTVLAALDDRSLKLEAQRWASQQEQYLTQAQDALAQRNLAQAQIASAQAQQAQAQRALAERKLQHTQLTAPFDGVLVSGDLSQHLGAAVQKGQVLFEISPLDQYRLVLWVSETDMAHLVVGQQGELVLSALPEDKFRFTLSLLTPVAQVQDGQNVFRVEARLAESVTAALLRPGMEGIGKIEIEPASLLWITTRQTVNWLRLQVWRWFGV